MPGWDGVLWDSGMGALTADRQVLKLRLISTYSRARREARVQGTAHRTVVHRHSSSSSSYVMENECGLPRL